MSHVSHSRTVGYDMICYKCDIECMTTMYTVYCDLCSDDVDVVFCAVLLFHVMHVYVNSTVQCDYR